MTIRSGSLLFLPVRFGGGVVGVLSRSDRSENCVSGCSSREDQSVRRGLFRFGHPRVRAVEESRCTWSVRPLWGQSGSFYFIRVRRGQHVSLRIEADDFPDPSHPRSTVRHPRQIAKMGWRRCPVENRAQPQRETAETLSTRHPPVPRSLFLVGNHHPDRGTCGNGALSDAFGGKTQSDNAVRLTSG
jgi:hypothetical protein